MRPLSSTDQQVSGGRLRSIHRESWGTSFEISASPTNVPLEVVFEIQLPSKGPRRLWDLAEKQFWRLIGQNRYVNHGVLIWVTNQTRPGLQYQRSLPNPIPRSD